MLTEKDYCDYETCVALEELGITDCGLLYYEKGCPNTLHRNLLQPLTIRTAKVLGRVLAISLYDAQKWLREEKDIHLAVYYGKGQDTDRVWFCNLVMEKKIHQLTREGIVVKTFPSYEEALSEGIKEAIKILKDGNNS